MIAASSAGVAFSTSTVDAPAWSGNSSTPPRPNVKAYGGVPVNTSSGDGRSTCREKVSQIASTSRWKCMVAFGRPVVPEVNASSATSSAEVATSSWVVGWPSRRALRPVSVPNSTTRTPRSPDSPSVPSTNRASTSARSSRAISWMVASSPGRSNGIVVTATAPALSTPNQHAVSHGLLGPRNSTRLPGTMPSPSTSAWATRFAAASRSAYDQVSVPGACRHGRSPPCSAITSSRSLVAQFRRSG